MTPKQLITERKAVKTQHKSPCSDCPWARKAMPGWLGGFTIQTWLELAHSDSLIHCHTRDKQCAGAAIFRANICKSSRDSEALTLPADRINVFSWDTEFEKHHKKVSLKVLRGTR